MARPMSPEMLCVSEPNVSLSFYTLQKKGRGGGEGGRERRLQSLLNTLFIIVSSVFFTPRGALPAPSGHSNVCMAALPAVFGGAA